MLARLWSNWNSHLFLVRIWNGTTTLNNCLALYNKVKCTFIIKYRNSGWSHNFIQIGPKMEKPECSSIGNKKLWYRDKQQNNIQQICPGCHNHRLDNLNNRHLFLTVLEPGKSKIKVLVKQFSETSSLG